MPPSPYRFNGDFIAQVGNNLDPFKKNMGMLELNLGGLGIAAGLGTLALGLRSFTLPPRMVENDSIPYLNGNVHYPTRPSALADVTAVFNDYGGPLDVREILELWFKTAVYDEDTGLMVPPSVGKVNGFAVLFSSNGVPAKGYLLRGILPKQRPGLDFDFTAGQIRTIDMAFSVDFITREFVNPAAGATAA